LVIARIWPVRVGAFWSERKPVLAQRTVTPADTNALRTIASADPHRPRATRQADDQRLFELYQSQGDKAARDALVERYLPLAHYFARRYRNSAGHADDLKQVAAIGLLNAIERFDPTRGIAFSSFAVPTIMGEVKRYFRDKGWAVRMPRDLQERALRIERVAEELEGELARVPTIEQIAQRLDMSVEHVLEARLASRAHHGVSLDRPDGEDEDGPGALGRALGESDPALDRAEDTITFDRLLASLDERQRSILLLRFRADMTQREIAARVGLSQMQVSRVIRQALEQLQASISASAR